jgi:hypothetical protein
MVKKSKKEGKIKKAEGAEVVKEAEPVQEDQRQEMTIPELEMSIRRHLEELSIDYKILGCTAINSLFAAYVYFVAQFTEAKDLTQIIMDHANHVCGELEKKIAEIEKLNPVEKK